MGYSKDFLIDLNGILEEILIWESNFQKGKREYDFDIDDKLYFISQKHNVNFKDKELKLIYNLVDFYCDAVQHGFNEIDKDYSLNQAKEDIVKVKNCIESNKFQSIILDKDLYFRLKTI